MISVYIWDQVEKTPIVPGRIQMSTVGFRSSMGGRIARAVAIIIGAVFMILPAYINYYLGPTKIGLEAPASWGITLEFFAIGIVLFIVAVGPEKFKPKSQTQ